jgi:hypothetical protein
MRLVLLLCTFAVVFSLATTSALATAQSSACSVLNPALAGARTGTSNFETLLNEALADGCVADVNDSTYLYAEFITSPMLGQAITIGPIGADLYDIALAPSGQLYGVDGVSNLYKINQDTGAATKVGQAGYPLVGLAVSSGGTIYGSGSKQLVVINPATGSGTPVGSGIGFTASGDLAFDASGNLYMTASGTSSTDLLVSVNTTTGVGTAVGAIGDPNVYGLGYSSGTLYGTDYQGNLLTIDPATGAGTVIATGGPKAQGMATPIGTNPVPTVNLNLVAPGTGQGSASGSGISCPTTCPVSTAKPRVTGGLLPHDVLSCSRGSWTNDPTTYTYQWYRNDAPLAGFRASRFRLGTMDEGTTLTCAVTAGNAAGQGSAASNGVKIPIPHVSGCPGATGTMTGTTIGQIVLGMTRTRAEYLYRRHSDRGVKYEDFFCLTPIGVRVGYPSPILMASLAKRAQASFRNRVIWASTSNPYYSLDGVHVGERFDFPRLIHIGQNYWYLIREPGYTAVLKIRGGVVEELGIATNALTRTHKAQVLLMRFFS